MREIERINFAEDFFGAGADEDIVGKLHPADLARRVENEFRGARDVFPVRAHLGMDQIPAADQLVVVVAKNQERIARDFPQVFGFFRRIHAHGRDANSARIELRQFRLETPQLGVAGGSPIAAIKNQHQAVRFARARRLRGPVVGAKR